MPPEKTGAFFYVQRFKFDLKKISAPDSVDIISPEGAGNDR
jgi:hypothetical protein